jgi:hypothetical protein
MSERPSRCPACQGVRLSHGNTTGRHAFVPDSQAHRWLPNVIVFGRAFVCLDCGFIGHYLDENALAKLRTDEAPEPKPKGPMDEV